MPNIKLTNEDNMELMARYPDNYFDLAIVDPPFGLRDLTKSKKSKHKLETTYKNDSIPNPEYFRELERVSKRSIIWGCQYMLPHLNPDGSFIVWHKKVDPDKQHFSSCDVAWYSKRERIKHFEAWWCGFIKVNNEVTIHPHQKPVKLYEWLLLNYAKKGEKILDTHLGSGSIAIACHNLNFDLTACEIDETYYKRAVKRFKTHQIQLRIYF